MYPIGPTIQNASFALQKSKPKYNICLEPLLPSMIRFSPTINEAPKDNPTSDRERERELQTHPETGHTQPEKGQ